MNASKVKNGSLSSADFARGQAPAGPQGPAGPQRPSGTALPNARYDAATSDVDVNGGGQVVNSLSLPAGTWVVLETLNAVDNTTTTTRLECTMSGPSGALDFAKVRLGPAPDDPSQFVRIAMSGAFATAAPTTVSVACASTTGTSLLIQSRHLVALPQAGLN